MTFLVDCMLGKLAKWLKILGFDVLYFPKADDDDLLALARREGRTLLSRDHALLARAKGLTALLIESETWENQVRQVLGRFDLYPEARPYSRCVECNAGLKPLSKSQAANLVTPFVHEREETFAICPSCGRVFWPGTHFNGMEEKIDGLLRKP
ncbi:MAG: Mut7-C RNAse domain-containing protein [Candidatus Aminicenantales bacterium]